LSEERVSDKNAETEYYGPQSATALRAIERNRMGEGLPQNLQIYLEKSASINYTKVGNSVSLQKS
jgi:hypothetical protein